MFEKSIFRKEAIESNVVKSYGVIKLKHPKTSFIVSFFIFLIGTAFLALIFFGEVSRKIKVVGITNPIEGMLRVDSPSVGVLKETKVKAGDIVKAGQSLFSVTVDRHSRSGAVGNLIKEQVLKRQDSLKDEWRVKKELFSERRESIKSRIANLNVKQKQLEQELALLIKRLENAKISLNQYRNLNENGFISSAQLRQKEDDELDVNSKIFSLRRNLTQLAASKIAFESELDILLKQ